MSLNHIIIMGRLTRNPELRATQSGLHVAHFSVAVDRDYGGRDGGEKQTDFIDCVAWRKTADFVNQYFIKGKPILVEGSLRTRKYEDKNGNKRTAWEVVAENVYFCGGDRVNSTAAEPGVFVDIDDSDGDLPWADGPDDLPL